MLAKIRNFRATTLHWLLGLPRAKKRAIQIAADVIILCGCFLVSMFLRLDSLSLALSVEPWLAFIVTLPITLALFIRLGLYRAVVRYISARAFRVIAIGVFCPVLIMLVAAQMLGLWLPRSVPFIYAMVAFLAVGAVRFSMRTIYRVVDSSTRTKVLIYGAGESGRQLFHSLHHSSQYQPVGFIDDNPLLRRAVIGGLSVYGKNDIIDLVSALGAETVLLAMPRITRAQRAELMEFLEPLPVTVQTIPSMLDLISGTADVDDIRAVSIEDILGRDPVPPHRELMNANIKGRTVFVSGAGGSIGSELCRQIIDNGPARLLLFEHSEFALYLIEQELRKKAETSGVDLIPVVGSVRDGERLKWLLGKFAVDTVYHAAAYKHVPMVEQNMIEGVRNNIFGTKALADASVHAGVKSFILISTDKAVRPTNLMGASKRMAELICQAHARTGAGTLFSMVRFGNVLGSSGSVIPLFSKQIETGGPVTVTHPEITRYFMTIPEAAQLVIQTGGLAKGGDVFLLDMGAPVRIADLAARMIRLSGKTPVTGRDAKQGEIAIEFTELRPGEKLYEELFIGATAQATKHPRILTLREDSLSPEDLSLHIEVMAAACEMNDLEALRRAMRDAPTLYDPNSEVVDRTGSILAQRSHVA
ncbi:polysaccharide biosynthesis protein [Meridianimarinicoccus aquatilis]|uniref:polysaccharide biosynthesis protein n=1 Tax=Meridianimarinicoccus aquatilis TaxID=2552766 RepID=UPI001FB71754|nr:nucleoside-diphosphate sugar epimerase/dehydratase [Fluviibacterium aquatile]